VTAEGISETASRDPEPNRAVRLIPRLALAGVVAAALLSLPVHLMSGPDGLRALGLGALVSLVNCFWGARLLLWGIARGNYEVQIAVFGGFFGRMVLAIAAVALLGPLPGVDAAVLLLSVVGFYFVGVFVEVRFLYREVLVGRAPKLAR